MNAHARQLFVNGLVNQPTRDGYDAGLADAWSYSVLEVEDHLRFIKQHRKTIAERADRLSTGTPVHSAATVKAARERLAYRLPLYLAAVRRVVEAERRMSLIAMRVAPSSDAWEAA